MLVEHAIPSSTPPAGARRHQFARRRGASFLVMADGSTLLALASSPDLQAPVRRRSRTEYQGMRVSPAPVVTPRCTRDHARDHSAGSQRHGCRRHTVPGFLYAGVMIDAAGNRRRSIQLPIGDPETQPIADALRTWSISSSTESTAHRPDRAEWDRGRARRRPRRRRLSRRPAPGGVISGLNQASDECKVFHAATSVVDGKVVTSGGRVLCVTALGDNVRHAQRNAYAAVASIHFDGMQFRTDIGHHALVARRG
jgi:phosphoribosylamine--glycine ligase